MPKPNKHPKIVAAYENIQSLTGMKLEGLEPEEVRNALKKIYIDGHNLYVSRNLEQTENVDDVVYSVSNTLRSSLDARNTTARTIFILEPDNPLAMPRLILPEKPLDGEGKVIARPNAQIKKNFKDKNKVAKDFEKQFKKNHRSNLEKAGRALAGYKMPESMKAEDYFEAGVLKEQNVLQSLKAEENAIHLCNLMLLGRGYTFRELQGKNEDVREAKRMAGAEVTALMDGSLSPEERSEKLAEIVNTARNSLHQLSLKQVDLSDESTLKNLDYNQWIASMADSLDKVVTEAKGTMDGKWIPEVADDVQKMARFTNGAVEIDRLRLQGVTGKSRKPEDGREAALAQAFVDKLGTDYTIYRTAPIGAGANGPDILSELHHTMQNEMGNQPDSQRVNSIRENIRDAVRESEELKKEKGQSRDEIFAWADGIPGMTVNKLCEEMRGIFSGSTSQQAARRYTMQSLFIGFGCWLAEQRNEKIEIKDFLTDAELQKKTGREALEFFRQHPIATDSTPEEKRESGRYFIDIIAALNRKLVDTELPKYDYRNPEEAKANATYASNFKTILCDSHQLMSVVKPMQDEFYAAHGGEEKYKELWNQISIGEVMVTALTDQIPENILKTNSLNSLFADDGAINAARGLYVLRNYGDKFLGRKIGDLPKDATGVNLYQTEFGAAPVMQGFAKMNEHRTEFKKQIREYLSTYGEKDAAGFEKKMTEVVAPLLLPVEEEPAVEEKEVKAEAKKEQVAEEKEVKEEAQEEPAVEEKEVRAEAQEEPEIVRMEDPGHNVEALAEEAAENSAVAAGAYDWSAEMPPAEWKKRLKKFYDELDSHDPALLRSSDEYRDVKKSLKKALDILDILDKPVGHRVNKHAFNEKLNEVFNRAGDYIESKSTATIGKHYGRERLNAMKNIRDLLADRNRDTLDASGIAAIFGEKTLAFDREKGQEVITTDNASQQEKLERGMKRLGIYLAMLEDSDPEKIKGKLELLERVIAERGKNSITREKLMDEMAQVKISEYTDNSEFMAQTKEQLMKRMCSQNGLDRQAAGWCKVLKAFDRMCQNSADNEIQAAGDDLELRNYLRLGGFAEKALAVQNKILDTEEAASVTKEEAAAVVAASAIGIFMKSKEKRPDISFKAKDVWDNRLLFNKFILKKSDSEIMEYFTKSGDTQAIQHEKTNEGLKQNVVGELAQEMIGIRGARKICAEMAVKEQKKQGAKPMKILRNSRKGMNK